jgi:hypothetical protein
MLDNQETQESTQEANPAAAPGATPHLPSADDIISSLRARREGTLGTQGSQESETQETPAEAERNAQATADKNAKRIAEVARREKRALEIERQTKETQAALEKERQELKAFNELREKYRANPGKYDPAEVFGHLGIDLDTFVKALIDGDKPESLEEKVARLEKEREDEKRAELEARTQAERQEEEEAMAQLQANIKELVSSNNETYELINLANAYEVVLDTMQAHWDQTKEVLPIEEAAQMVEDYLLAESTKQVKASKKLARLFEAPAAPAKPASMAQVANTAPTGSRTLKPASVATPVEAPKYETHEEAIERIMAKVRANKANK